MQPSEGKSKFSVSRHEEPPRNFEEAKQRLLLAGQVKDLYREMYHDSLRERFEIAELAKQMTIERDATQKKLDQLRRNIRIGIGIAGVTVLGFITFANDMLPPMVKEKNKSVDANPSDTTKEASPLSQSRAEISTPSLSDRDQHESPIVYASGSDHVQQMKQHTDEIEIEKLEQSRKTILRQFLNERREPEKGYAAYMPSSLDRQDGIILQARFEVMDFQVGLPSAFSVGAFLEKIKNMFITYDDINLTKEELAMVFTRIIKRYEEAASKTEDPELRTAMLDEANKVRDHLKANGMEERDLPERGYIGKHPYEPINSFNVADGEALPYPCSKDADGTLTFPAQDFFSSSPGDGLQRCESIQQGIQ